MQGRKSAVVLGLAACALALVLLGCHGAHRSDFPHRRLVATHGRSHFRIPAHTRTVVRSTVPASPSQPGSVATGPTPAASTPTTAVDAPPAIGRATAWGCAAARAYLDAYAAPGFSIECPGYSQGHEATTLCVSLHSPCDEQREITIAEPCPEAYMNEASNSWVLLGSSGAPIDPYGQCP